MKEKILYCIWAAMYILCVGLGTVQSPAGFGKFCLTAVAVLFFVPGGVLLYDAIRSGNRRGVVRIRRIAAASLVLTLAALIANLFCAMAPENVGNVMHEILQPVLAFQHVFVGVPAVWHLHPAAEGRRGSRSGSPTAAMTIPDRRSGRFANPQDRPAPALFPARG